MTAMQTDAANELTNEDIQHLRWLAIGHYVLGGLTVLCGFFPFIHLTVGIGLLTGQMGADDPGQPELVGAMFVGIATLMIAMFWISAGLTIYAGRCLVARRRRTLCFVVAVLSCVFLQPIGLVLGIFSIIVLNRPSVKAAFDADGAVPRAF